MIELRLGDCLEVMKSLPDGCVDSVVTDPPSGIGFMGKDWDKDKGGRGVWISWLAERMAECLRLAKPGSRALVWALPRTSHWTATAVEDAGWVIEDRISHLFGQGWPKAKSKLKPAVEDWWLARKPSKGVPPLNIDACRIGHSESIKKTCRTSDKFGGNDFNGGRPGHFRVGDELSSPSPSGRWPANLVLTCCGEKPHAEGCPVSELDAQTGVLTTHAGTARSRHKAGMYGPETNAGRVLSRGDSGGASRFFYCSKASRKDRGEGNTHPTCKSADLMRWLCRLITPPGGTILDPFAGSGSTFKAAIPEGFSVIGVEINPGYHAIAQRRIADELARHPLLTG